MKSEYLIQGEVNGDMVQAFWDALFCRPKGTTTILLNTSGGSDEDSLAIHDMIIRIRKEKNHIVKIIATGACQSAGITILQAATERLATPNCIFMTHESSIFEKATLRAAQVGALHQQLELLNEASDAIILERSQMNLKKYEKINNTDYYFNAKEALELNLIDRILL